MFLRALIIAGILCGCTRITSDKTFPNPQVPADVDYKICLSVNAKAGVSNKGYSAKDVSLTVLNMKGSSVLTRSYTLQGDALTWDCPILNNSSFKIRFISDLKDKGIKEQAVILSIWFERDASGKWHEELVNHGLPPDYVGDSGTGLAYGSIAMSEAAGGEPSLLGEGDDYKYLISRYHIPIRKPDQYILPKDQSIQDYNTVIMAYYIGKLRIPAKDWMPGSH